MTEGTDMTDETNTNTEDKTNRGAVILLATDVPLWILVDASGSMNNTDSDLVLLDNDVRHGPDPAVAHMAQPIGATRRDYAIARLRALLEQAPSTLEVHLMQFGTQLTTMNNPMLMRNTEMTLVQAALDMLSELRANEANTNVGAALNHVRHSTHGEPANVLIIIDGDPTDSDAMAFADHQFSLRDEQNKVSVRWLTLGAHDEIKASLGDIGGVWPLPQTEVSFGMLVAFGANDEPPKRPTMPSVPPEATAEDQIKQAEMAAMLARDLADPDFHKQGPSTLAELEAAATASALETPPDDPETATTDPLPPPAADLDAAQQPEPHKRRHKDKHHR